MHELPLNIWYIMLGFDFIDEKYKISIYSNFLRFELIYKSLIDLPSLTNRSLSIFHRWWINYLIKKIYDICKIMN